MIRALFCIYAILPKKNYDLLKSKALASPSLHETFIGQIQNVWLQQTTQSNTRATQC